MKQFKTNTKTWLLLDDASELYRKRLPIIKDNILRTFENDDVPSVNKFREDFKKLYDKGQYFDSAILVDNLFSSVNKKDITFENMDYAFSMICLREGEDQLNTDSEYHKQKLLELDEDGLRSDVAAREVLNFMMHCPYEFRNFEGIVQLMKEYYSIKK